MASEPLTTEELERIERTHRCNPTGDAMALLAEVRRLEAETKERLACEAEYQRWLDERDAEIARLRANPDRSAAYALVESEMRACGLVELHRSDAGHNRPGTRYIRDAAWMYEGEYRGSSRPTAFVKTLIEAVDKLRGDSRGENDNGQG